MSLSDRQVATSMARTIDALRSELAGKDERIKVLEAALGDALSGLDASECTEDHDAAGRTCPKACIARLRALLPVATPVPT